MENFFIGLGFMKCATTFLTMRLSRHPDIYMPPIRELHFWENHFNGTPLPRQNKYALKALNKIRKKLKAKTSITPTLRKLNYWHRYANTKADGLTSYASLFKPRRNQKAAGEICPRYVEINRDNLIELAEMLPNARILVSMRAPYGRLVSHYNHASRLRLDEVRDDETTLNWLHTPRVNAQVEYAVLLENAFNAFGCDRVKVLFYEDMVADQVAFFRDLLDFIGVPFHERVIPPSEKVHTGTPKREMSERLKEAFRERVQHVPRAVEQLIGSTLPAWNTP